MYVAHSCELYYISAFVSRTFEWKHASLFMSKLFSYWITYEEELLLIAWAGSFYEVSSLTLIVLVM